ncbi:glycosyltransferase family 2 protein [Chitinasiproducens palmae]|uniref:Rhamnosyltransferase n=1 Tax=Chitinasiproducens palmae TaxID=1770053 RepID=A0A1H2PMS3_9BURK|nr:glycosyltransferase family 2 protein [Chitinasiproducens palmae]SDV47830.1 rhamnosyltransferase [Chitinasiproducens palmae]
MASLSPGCGTVVVFFHPDPACVARANRYATLGPCAVVDNTPRRASAAELGLAADVHYIGNAANLGIATALNQGVAQLRALACDAALLFDQDSEPSAALWRGLVAALSDARAAGRRVAVVGPAYEDARLGGVAPFVRFGFPRLQRVPAEGSELVEIDFLITSGSCVNLHAWTDIGEMDEGLFIDFVDVEWCVRARRAGYAVLGAPWLRLAHALGGEPIRVLGRRYPSHGPVRHYYLFRNAVALIRRAYMPAAWKCNELLKMPARLVIYGIWLRPRSAHVTSALRGICDGLRGRSGPMPVRATRSDDT